MFQLMKYEARKSFFSKLIMLLALAACELLFLFGIFFSNPESDPWTALGVAGLMIVTIAGITFIGIESIITLHRDLNTKQSYMLFMTPRNAYQILGSKILENALMIAAAAVFFLLLAAIDISILITKLGGIVQLIEMYQSMLQAMLDFRLDWHEIAVTMTVIFGEGVIGWFSMIVLGYLAVILSTAVFAGKKYSGFISIVLYVFLAVLQEKIVISVMRSLTENLKLDAVQEMLCYGGMTLIIGVAIYLLSCFVVEKKLSV